MSSINGTVTKQLLDYNRWIAKKHKKLKNSTPGTFIFLVMCTPIFEINKDVFHDSMIKPLNLLNEE